MSSSPCLICADASVPRYEARQAQANKVTERGHPLTVDDPLANTETEKPTKPLT